MNQYQLFIGRYKELPEEEYSYYTPTSGYMLVFTDKDISDSGFKKVLPEKEQELPNDAKIWLINARLSVVGKMHLTAEETLSKINILLSYFEDFKKSQIENNKKE